MKDNVTVALDTILGLTCTMQRDYPATVRTIREEVKRLRELLSTEAEVATKTMEEMEQTIQTLEARIAELVKEL